MKIQKLIIAEEDNNFNIYILLLCLLLLFFSCDKNKMSTYSIKDGFIKKEGNYYTKNIKIVVKKVEDGSFVYAVCNRRDNENIYQGDIMKAFNDFHFWIMYVDLDERIWMYDSDYDYKKVLVRNNKNNQYEEVDYCKNKMEIPRKFLKELKNHNLSDCDIQ